MIACPGAEDFFRRFDVSRETMARLQALQEIALIWTNRINLMSRDSAAAIWSRHIADSAQLWPLRTSAARTWADLGAGAGFPGLVIAAMAADARSPIAVTLVESNVRKSAFLAEAARAMSLTVRIETTRIESLAPLNADVLSARALAPLDRLLAYVEKHRAPSGMALFPKGATVHKEIETAARTWRFERQIHDSITEPGAAIVQVGAVSRV